MLERLVISVESTERSKVSLTKGHSHYQQLSELLGYLEFFDTEPLQIISQNIGKATHLYTFHGA